MPRHFNSISCHLRFHRGLGVCSSVAHIKKEKKEEETDCNFKQAQWKCRVQPIRFNHVWRNVILEDTGAESGADAGIGYAAKKKISRVRIPQIWMYGSLLVISI